VSRQKAPTTERAHLRRVTSAMRREELMKLTCLFLTVCLTLANSVSAQSADTSRLIGAAIYSADGAEVGTISDVSLDENGRLSAVRIAAGARLGFGVRTVEVPGRAVTIVRGVAVLDVPKEAVELLPSTGAQEKTDGE
jgi:sporulation protein YlmC with PRC-barrel domain